MIPKQCERLAEVDFPIAEVSKHAVREKSIRYGRPSALHLWWARKPLASSRAVLLALLLPNPCDPHCPDMFKQKARRILSSLTKGGIGPKNEELQIKLREFIGKIAGSNSTEKAAYIDAGRALVRAAYNKESPLVVDPFSGGGSMPLEALNLGCEAFASDLNPVACVALKVMLEDIPRHGPQLAEELLEAGAKIKQRAEQELADLYPRDPDGAVPTSYLWARTVRCEAPNCGAEIPLTQSFWLCRKANRRWALRHHVMRPKDAPPHAMFEIFNPTTKEKVHTGTVTRTVATCLCCDAMLPPERVRAQIKDQHGGADVVFDQQGHRTGGARIMAVVTLKPGQKGRRYRLPTEADYAAVYKAQQRLVAILSEWERDGKQRLCPIPDEPLPESVRDVRGRYYGMNTWGHLFTIRQKVALVELGKFMREEPSCQKDAAQAAMAICIDKVVMYNSNGCRWKASGESFVDAFGLHALPMVWYFAESSPISGTTGDIHAQIKRIAEFISSYTIRNSATVQSANATDHPLPDQAAGVWFTDPPYYDAIAYADLSDFFLVWLKRMLPDHPLLRNSFNLDNPLSPKDEEIIQDTGRAKDRDYYESCIKNAFAEGCRVLQEDGIGSVVFAHKSTEGWEALLSGMIQGGWTITASWPIATEMSSRLHARDTASLATSIYLVCRPRPKDAPIGDWVKVLQELPVRVSDWMERLQGEGIRGADLVFSCIGPALKIFSRYSGVETVEGRKIGLPEYLEKVWEVVGRTALEQVLGKKEAQAHDGAAGVLEEDARLTALFLWTMQSTEVADENGEQDGDEESDTTKTKSKGFSLPFDVVRRFAQPMGIDLDRWTDHIIGQEKGIVRLLPVTERAKDLFGKEGAETAADWIESDANERSQLTLFSETGAAPPIGKRRGKLASDDDVELQSSDATVLDRVHASMLLQAGGHTNALRALLADEKERGPDFLRLANALSALYPTNSQEKRLLDAMLLAVPK